MNNDFTDITVVLDRSGSMVSIWEETISSFAHFLQEQGRVPGKCHVSLRLFDDQHDSPFTAENPNAIDAQAVLSAYSPRGRTAMYDAIGRGIVETGERLTKIAESDRPGNVLFVIITDGYENASKEYTQRKIADMIRHQQEKYGWDFSVMGTNIDAITIGKHINVDANSSLNFTPDAQGIKCAMATLSDSASLYRTAKLADPNAKYSIVQPTAGENTKTT